MIGKIGNHISGNVIAYVALFFALTSTSYAAVSLSKGSVKSKHIAKKAVKKKHIAKNAITSHRVKNGTLRTQDFRKKDLKKILNKNLLNGIPGSDGTSGVNGQNGSSGGGGSQGLQGLQGVQGTSGLAGAKGEKGEKGDEGIHGADGFQGPQGPKGDKGSKGVQGLQGAKGDKGSEGDQGPVGISGYEIKVASTTASSSSFKYVSAYCSSGKKAIGGGAIISDTVNEPVPVSVTESAPSVSGTSWRVRADENQYTGHNWMIQAHVICAKFDS